MNPEEDLKKRIAHLEDEVRVLRQAFEDDEDLGKKLRLAEIDVAARRAPRGAGLAYIRQAARIRASSEESTW